MSTCEDCKGCLIRDVDLDRVGRELRDAETEIATLRAQLAAVEKERDVARARLDELREMHSQMCRASAEHQRERDEARADLAAVRGYLDGNPSSLGAQLAAERTARVTAQAEAAAVRNRLANEILRGYSTDSPHARGGCGVECPCGARSDDGDADHIEHRSGCALATDAGRPFLALLDAARACRWPEFEQLRAAVAAIDGGDGK